MKKPCIDSECKKNTRSRGASKKLTAGVLKTAGAVALAMLFSGICGGNDDSKSGREN